MIIANTLPLSWYWSSLEEMTSYILFCMHKFVVQTNDIQNLYYIFYPMLPFIIPWNISKNFDLMISGLITSGCIKNNIDRKLVSNFI